MQEIYLENRTINQKTGKRHSKFYRMKRLDVYEFEATFGAIGSPGKPHIYSMSEWHPILEKKRAKGYDPVTENVDDFQSQLNPEVIDKLERLIKRVESRGVKSDLPKAQTLLNTYKRFRTLDKTKANTLFEKYNSTNMKIRKDKAIEKAEKAIEIKGGKF